MADKKLRFAVKLVGQEGSSATGFYAPFDVPATFGTRARVPVRGTINGYPFRSSLMPMGGGYCMAVNQTMREGAGVRVGDEVEIVMERDAEERTVEAPSELKKELARNKKAKERWQLLAFTVKKEIANAISGAKQEETKKRRLAKVMGVLESGAKWTG
ncbi:MAG TPA: YdeI/OmpD-associated family protein [Verrucomicrobiae bacterium]|nr:YdeI/OmpD-associated family protein [Verrucomicrobiae bacterium]